MKTTKTRTKKPAPKTKATAAARHRGPTTRTTTRATPPKALAALQGIVGKLMTMTDQAIHSDTDTFEQLKARFKDGMKKAREKATSKDDTRDRATIWADINERHEETLRFAQAVRRHKGDPDGFVSGLIARLCVSIGEDRSLEDRELDAIQKRIAAFNKAAGLTDDEYWPRGEGPEEYEAMNVEFEQRMDDIIVEVMREHGEHDLVKLFQDDRDEFDRRIEEDRKRLFGDKGDQP